LSFSEQQQPLSCLGNFFQAQKKPRAEGKWQKDFDEIGQRKIVIEIEAERSAGHRRS
jgi:hypothetical protein